MKKTLSVLLAMAMTIGLVACGGASANKTTTGADQTTAAGSEKEAVEDSKKAENLTETQKIIQEAQGMTMEELAKKAIEESNGKMFYGVGNSSRGKTALPLFVKTSKKQNTYMLYSFVAGHTPPAKLA